MKKILLIVALATNILSFSQNLRVENWDYIYSSPYYSWEKLNMSKPKKIFKIEKDSIVEAIGFYLLGDQNRYVGDLKVKVNNQIGWMSSLAFKTDDLRIIPLLNKGLQQNLDSSISNKKGITPPGAYQSKSLSEFIWSKSKNKYIKTQEVTTTSYFIINPTYILYNKKNEGWTKSNWISEINLNTDFIAGEFENDLSQKVIVYPEGKNEIWCYWGEKNNTQAFQKLTIYREIQKNDQIIQDYLSHEYLTAGGILSDEILNAFEQNNFSKVINLSKRMLFTDNVSYDDAFLFFAIATSFYAINDFKNALINYNKSIAIWGSENVDASTYDKMGLCELNLKNYESAIKFFTKAIDLGYVDSYLSRAVSYIQNDEFKEALLDFSVAEDLSPIDKEGYNYYYGKSYMELASSYLNKKEYHNAKLYYGFAIDKFDEELRINENSSASYKMKGMCFELSGNKTRALDMYKKSLGVRSNQPDVQELVNKLTQESEIQISLTKRNGTYMVPVFLNEVVKTEFIFDSGAAEVLISPEIAMELIKNKTIGPSEILEDGYFITADGSNIKLQRFILREVKLGSKKIFNVECAVSKNFGGDMLLGQSFMEKLGKYTFDYKKSVLILH